MVEKIEFSLIKLIRSIVTIGVIGFGGGAAVLPLFHKQFVERYKWLTDDEFQDMLSVSNALPGPIQTKVAGYIGYKLKGILGMIISTLSIILPSLLAMLLLYNTINLYKDETWVSSAIASVFPVVTVLMLSLTVAYFKKSSKKLSNIHNGILLLLSIITLVILDINPALLIIIILISVFLQIKNDNYRFIFMYGSILVIFILSLVFTNTLEYNVGLNLDNASNLTKVVYAFFVPGILGYGGGPGSLSLISFEIVEHVKLLTSDEFALVVAIQASLPGVTATKLAGSIGYQSAGFLGLVLSIFVYVTPSMILMVMLLNLLNKYKDSPVIKRLSSYVGPVIVVLLGKLTFNFFLNSLSALDWLYTIIFLTANILLLMKLKIHPFFVILLSMTVGVLITII